MSKKISIIIPVYNGQEYLDRCIDSIVSQKGFNRSDLDIIFLDDESTDSSPSVRTRYGLSVKKIWVLLKRGIEESVSPKVNT